MAKKKYKRYDKYPDLHYYDFGSTLNNVTGAVGTGMNILSKAFKTAQGIDTEPYLDKAEDFGNQEVAASSNDELLNAWGARTYMDNMDKYDITGGSPAGDVIGGIGSALTDTISGATTGSKFGPIGAIIGGAAGLATNTIGQIFGAVNTEKKLKELNKTIDIANARQDRAFNDAAANLEKKQEANMMANFAAHGGSIHIKPSKRGTFTAQASKMGMGVQEAASHILANKEDYSPAMVKKANFARNAAKWHADGGMLFSDNFTNGVTFVNNGDTHENNPFQGVQMGIAPDGLPNLVEEGEAIYNDYVFSNRLKVPKAVRNKYKLRGPKDMTFAQAFEKAQKESEERPNDPISKDGLDDIAMILMSAQEEERQEKSKGHKKAKGGHLFAGLPIEEEVSEPDVDLAIQNFWKSKLGDYYNSPEARNNYMNNDPTNPVNNRTTRTDGYTGTNPFRLAEPFANLGAVFSDMVGATNNPYNYDYIPAFQTVSYTPLSNYLPTYHTDTRYAANQAAQQAAATRNAIMQSTSPNRNASLLAADYNAQIANGELLRQAALDDYNMMAKREEFNRATNQANSQMGLQAALANQDARLKYAQSALQQAKMNVDETNATMGAKAQNISSLAESIANIGREQDAMNWRDMLIRAGVYGPLSEKPFDWSEKKWKAYQDAMNLRANGGRISRKKRGLTY